MEDKTIEFFKEISKIPRESGNEKQISDYICRFAKERNLEYIQDKYNNVIIKKYTGTNKPIILQAHLDMVCEKINDKEFDFNIQELDVYEEDGYLKARGTTLGADNGIGVAQILNVLDSNLKINIEAIFTVEEETTMIGAENIDLSTLKGKTLINLDGFEENTIITESASFYDIILKTNYDFSKERKSNMYKVQITGLEGGHSGFEIDKERGNSIIELAKLLLEIGDVEIYTFIGGTKFNVIPSEAESIFFSEISLDKIKEIINRFEQKEKEKFSNISIMIGSEVGNSLKTMSKEDTKKFLKAITSFKHGVFDKNENNEVTTSQNLGVVNLAEKIIKIGMRSSRKEEEERILEYLKQYSEENNFAFTILGSQPGFETKKDSKLVQKLIQAYTKIGDEINLQVKPVHITVEVGFLKDKIPELEVAIISPKIIGAHTVNEKVEIASVQKCDKWLENFLKSIC